jgi:hypothetical protein
MGVAILSCSHPKPVSRAVEQESPNPFSASNEISYSLPDSSHVLVTLYNVQGQIVDTLVNEDQKAGLYTRKIVDTTLPGGVYFFRLTAGKFSATKKVVLYK